MVSVVNAQQEDEPDGNVVDLATWKQTHTHAVPTHEHYTEYPGEMRAEAENIRLKQENKRLKATVEMSEIAGSMYAALFDTTNDTLATVHSMLEVGLGEVDAGQIERALMHIREAAHAAKARIERTAKILGDVGTTKLPAAMVAGTLVWMFGRWIAWEWSDPNMLDIIYYIR